MTIIRPINPDGAVPLASGAPVSPMQPSAPMTAAMRDAWLSFKTRRAIRAARAELMALDDDALKDIGLERSEIESVLATRTRERRISVIPVNERSVQKQALAHCF